MAASVEIVALMCNMVLGIALPAWVVRRDMERLAAEELARSWNTASFWVAVVMFGPMCIPVHFVKVRRSLGGLMMGAIWTALVVLVLGIVTVVVEGALARLLS